MQKEQLYIMLGNVEKLNLPKYTNTLYIVEKFNSRNEDPNTKGFISHLK